MIKFNDNESISLQCNSIKAVNSGGTAFSATADEDVITKAYADANYSGGGGGGATVELYKEYDINSEADLIAAVDELNTGNIVAATLWMNEEWDLTQDIELAPQVCQYIYMDGVFGMGQGGDNYEFSLNNANYLICMDIYNPIRIQSNAKSVLFNTDNTSRYISTSTFHSEALYTVLSNTDIDPTGNGEFSVSNGVCIVTNGTTITSGAMMSFSHCIAYFDGDFATDYATEISIANCWHN